MAIELKSRERFISKLSRWHSLDEKDHDALQELPITSRTYEAGQYMIRDGELPSRCAFLLTGFAYRQKLAATGGRMIVGLIGPSDFTDLQQLFLHEADHNVQALTRLDAAEVSIADLRVIAGARPNIGRALWIDTLIEGSILREALLNVGRRDGITRVAHMLCEFAFRQSAFGFTDETYELPMTQEQIGDATGLTSVHVNRALRQLETERLISRQRRFIRILDRPGMVDRGDFTSRYLHLEQATLS